MRDKEEIIHDEMQSLRANGFTLIRWGVGLLAFMELALAVIRRSGYASLVAEKHLEAGHWLPFGRHALGTILLLVVATIFSAITIVESRRFRFYSNLLRNDQSAVSVPNDVAGADGLIVAMYAAFPIIDLLLWPYLRTLYGA